MKTLKQMKKQKAEIEKNCRLRLKLAGFVSYRRDILPEWKIILDEMIAKLKAKD